jgi:hypothetical protein
MQDITIQSPSPGRMKNNPSFSGFTRLCGFSLLHHVAFIVEENSAAGKTLTQKY